MIKPLAYFQEIARKYVVQGTGFEPAKHYALGPKPSPFDRSGTPAWISWGPSSIFYNAASGLSCRLSNNIQMSLRIYPLLFGVQLNLVSETMADYHIGVLKFPIKVITDLCCGRSLVAPWRALGYLVWETGALPWRRFGAKMVTR